MKIDKKMLDGLVSLPDEKLFAMLKLFFGEALPMKEPDERTLSGIRSLMSGVTESDIERAAELISLYKKGKKG